MVWKYKYEELLESALTQLPESSRKATRFEMPKVKGMIEGNKTIITNIVDIANYLGRDVHHLIKFLNRELATSATLKGNRAIFVGKFSSSQLNQKLEKYVKEFVICKECKKTDTKLVKEDRVAFLKCMACGARYPVRNIK